MTTSEPDFELLEALRELQVAARALRQEVERPFAHSAAPLERFQAIVSALGPVKAARSLRCPDEYVQHWQEVLAGRHALLTPRAIRYLCWEPEVATDSQFLDQLPEELSPRSLQGLVRSCHSRWSPAFAIDPVVQRIRHRLESYQGPHRVLARWRETSTMLLGLSGHKEFAAEMLKQRQPVSAYCTLWAIEESSLYIREAMLQAVQDCHDRMRLDATLHQYLLTVLLPWPRWLLQDFKAAVGATILHPTAMEVPERLESLTSFVLGHPRLGDPRLPRNATNWLGVPEEARLRFIRWLSRADITFFFEHVLPSGIDRHGRKPFWLQYVPHVLMSRPLLHRTDEVRLLATIRQSGDQVGHFGFIDGACSAFLLDFGPILVIEFSIVGACYIYAKHNIDSVIQDFWSSSRYTEYQLKQRSICVERVRHIHGWQEKMTGILARYGIRPA